MELVIGIDLGTQGVRILAVDAHGKVIASATEKLTQNTSQLPPGWAEQDPLDWWRATIFCLRHVTGALPTGAKIAGIAIDSTSGTILPVDGQGTPLYPALMYNDSRSNAQVLPIRQTAVELEHRLGYAFNASFALPKILWLLRERPHVYARTHLFVHATDFINGRLTGDYGVTDYSDALKTGYDLERDEWPPFIEHELGLPIARLPRVVAPGKPIGCVSPSSALETGLASGIPVFGGATDGTASQIASGAVQPGAWNSSLGTTLVIKGITRQLLHDPLNRIYSHRHPDGWWMPGGASNTGCEWIMREYPGQDLRQMDEAAALSIPTQVVRYPLARLGERFPFLRPEATGFSSAHNPSLTYAAGLEGTALIERLCYDTLQQIGAEVGPKIHVTGGGSKSEIWLRIRASVLQRQLIRPVIGETAMGAALLAATGAWYGSLSQAAGEMVRPDTTMDPDPVLIEPYAGMYDQLCTQLHQRGYM